MSYEELWDELGIDPDEEVGILSSEYVPSSKFPPPPPIGNYDYRGEEGGFQWGRDKDKNLYLKNLKLVIVGGEHDGKKFDGFISNRKFAYRPEGTDMEDFLRAGGAVPAGKRFTNLEIVQAVEATFTKIRQGYMTWEGYCKNCGKTVARGKKQATKEYQGFKMAGFLKGENLSPIVECPICQAMVQARLKLQRTYVG
jgi:hypothetical protein